MFRKAQIVINCLMMVIVLGCADKSEVEVTDANEPSRDPNWAVAMELEGVPNFHKVSDALYRSAQPTAQGMQNLEAMGIKAVLNLRSFHNNKKELEGTNLIRHHLTMKAWHPEEKEARAFLQIVSDPNNLPMLVHCQHGADRTGTICAIYRIATQGWSKEKAIQEMKEGGYGFHSIWKNLPTWIDKLNVEAIKPGD